MKLIVIFWLFLIPVLCFDVDKSGIFQLIQIKQLNNIIENSNPDTQCNSDIKTFISDLHKLELWALQMLDASAKIQPGLLNGNLFQMGSYDECLAIKRQHEGRFIEGQYCTLILAPNENSMHSNLMTTLGFGKNGVNESSMAKYFLFSFGICVPKSCRVEHLENMWNYTEKSTKLPFQIVYLEDLCVYKGKPFETYAIDFYVFLLFGIILIMVIGSTIYDIHCQRNYQQPGMFVIFSLYTNTKKLLSTHCDTALSCLYGMKVLSMIWIIFGHIWLLKAVTPKTNSIQYFLKEKNTFKGTFLISATFAVETFFSISGILVVYVQMKHSEKSRISLLAYYSHRFLRLSPAILAAILFYISVMKYISDGPLWHIIANNYSQRCHSNWWSTFFFFTNRMPVRDQCIPETWYLSVDSQLYCLAPIILIFIKKHPRRVLTGMTIACLFCIVHNFNVTIKHNLGSTFFDLDDNYFEYFFLSTLSRTPAWLIGIMCGFMLYRHGHKKRLISKKSNSILLTFSLCLMLGIILYHVTLTTDDYNVYRAAFHNALARPLWCLAVCYVIFSCSNGLGGFINTFLSHPVFVVLGKLTYCMYLVHLGVLITMSGHQREPAHLGYFEVFVEFWADCGIILVCSTLVCLIFETPVLSLLKYSEQSKSQTKKIIRKSISADNNKFEDYNEKQHSTV